MNKCDTCGKQIKEMEVKICRACHGHYHYQCLGISTDNYLKESKNSKVNWKCPQCKTKEKKGDNAPVRSQAYHTESPPKDGSMSNVSEELKVYFDSKFEEVSNKISKDVQSKIARESKETNAKIQSLTEGVQYMTSQVDELKNLLALQSKEITALKETNLVLRDENSDLKNKVTDMNLRLSQVEQQARECNLEIQCVPEAKNENVIDIVKQISHTVAFNLGENDLLTALRVAKMNNDSSRPRAIIVKLATPHVRDNFLGTIRLYNRAHIQDKLNTAHLGMSGDKRPIYVSEHLSPANKQLHAAARAAAAAKSLQFVWVRNGRVFVRRDINSKPILIKDLDFVKSL